VRLEPFMKTVSVGYVGDYVDDRQTGKGKYTWFNGDVYEGDFVDGMRTGKGKLTWANGDVYEGDWVDGKRTGKGKLIWANGDVYEGDWVDSKRTGKGQFSWASGKVFEGDYLDGKMKTGVFVEAAAITDSEKKQSYDAVFAGGNEIRNGFLVYTVKFSLRGQVVKEGEFRNCEFVK
jgi:hypothetical protein